MELNHQIRLCRPFPFLFGFRALLSEPRRQRFALALEFASPNVAEQRSSNATPFCRKVTTRNLPSEYRSRRLVAACLAIRSIA